MKCPYRKITYHFPENVNRFASDEEGFADCYGRECPLYDNGFCKRVLWKEGGAK